MNTIFNDIGLVVILATAFALVARLFKQPPLIGYILTGITLGPLGIGVLNNHQDLFDALRQIGVALLLFLVGLELDWTKAKQQMNTIVGLSLMQVVASFATSVVLGKLFGLTTMEVLYAALCLSFASTVVVVKVLSESRDLNSLPGRLSVGISLFQDILAILALTAVGSLSGHSSLSLFSLLTVLAVKLAAVLALVWVLSQYILPRLFSRIAHSGELLFLASLAWCFIFSIAMSAYDFPIETGALLAGVSLASLPYTLDMLTRLRPLRDFFVILLFVVLGSSVVRPSLATLPLIAVLVVIAMVIKPFFSFAAINLSGYTSRTAFMAALTQAPISEFALLLLTLGLHYGQITPGFASSITVATIISLLLATIALTHRVEWYNWLRPILHRLRFFRHRLRVTTEQVASAEGHIIIFGYHRMGYHILKKLRDLNHRVIVVDFNPDIIKRLRSAGVECVYGDVQDEELLELINAKSAAMIISTLPHREETAFLIQELRKMRARGHLIVTAHHIDDALDYYKKGAGYVILPHVLGGEHVAELITQYQNHELGKLLRHRAEEIKLLRTRSHALYYD